MPRDHLNKRPEFWIEAVDTLTWTASRTPSMIPWTRRESFWSDPDDQVTRAHLVYYEGNLPEGWQIQEAGRYRYVLRAVDIDGTDLYRDPGFPDTPTPGEAGQ